jgi:hypothetical protein
MQQPWLGPAVAANGFRHHMQPAEKAKVANGMRVFKADMDAG